MSREARRDKPVVTATSGRIAPNLTRCGARTALLAPHGAGAGAAVEEIECRAERTPGGVSVTYEVRGDIERLAIPPRAPAARRIDGLWEHTCFEAFVAVEGLDGYTELNFSPSGEWAAYTFDAYRAGRSRLEIAAPVIAVLARRDRLVLSAAVDLPALPVVAGRPLRLGLCAVIEDKEGSLSYWALAHPSKRPDFHHPGGFVLALA
ncbi:MAG TPA: DOMON-like domain-containing protein [candidate division Zixibacteria bacterium]|nr:DOMON-like domain-containing protein [candidate division Zixibacteria bacterium]